MAIKVLDDLLQIAIQHEISSQKFYQDSIGKTSDRKVQNFLKSLVEEEKSHEKILVSIREMEIYKGSIPVDEKMIIAAQQSHNLPIPELGAEPSLEEIYEIALRRETRAHLLFQQLARVTENEDLKELFINLAEEERNHHKNIEQGYRAQTGQFGPEI
jgi:rubrerythrin